MSPSPSVPSDALPDLADKTRFLQSPTSYPEATSSVEVVDTHMARVFLTGRFAYKLKKPVRQTYLDFTTLDRRYADCCEELRLNRRLTDDVYLEVIALRLNADRQLTFAGRGLVVDWLVKMRRLPAAASLPQLIENDRVSPSDMAPLLARLCDFYRAAAAIPLGPEQYLQRLRGQFAQLRTQLLAPELALDGATVESIHAALIAFTEGRGGLLGARAGGGRIVEGHGDLRPEHCFLTEPPQVIDCLEFSRALRCVDPLDELSYLALECELLGRADLAAAVLDGYRDCVENFPAPLGDFYKAQRAFLRAQLAAAHLQDGEVADTDKWVRKTAVYLDAALGYSKRLAGS